MPFMIRYPGVIKAGSKNEKMILNVDFAPTFLELAGITAPADLQGRSIMPLLAGRRANDWRTSMYYRYYHYPGDHRVQPHWGIRTERYKLIYFNKLDCWELFDLQKDPDELKNVYADPKNAKKIVELKLQLERLRRDLDDRDQFADIQK